MGGGGGEASTTIKGSGWLSLILLHKYYAQIEWDAKQARTPTPYQSHPTLINSITWGAV